MSETQRYQVYATPTDFVANPIQPLIEGKILIDYEPGPVTPVVPVTPVSDAEDENVDDADADAADADSSTEPEPIPTSALNSIEAAT